MLLGRRVMCVVVGVPLSLAVACGSSTKNREFDKNDDTLIDDLGKFVDGNGDGAADSIDINHDGKLDGPGVDIDSNGSVDALAIDSDCDGLYDSYDTTGDGRPDFVSSLKPPAESVADCVLPGVGNGAGGSSSTMLST